MLRGATRSRFMKEVEDTLALGLELPVLTGRGPCCPAANTPHHSRGCSYTSLKTFVKALALTLLKRVSRKQRCVFLNCFN